MIFAFDEFEVDDRLFQLRRAGNPVRLEPRVFDLLLHLVRHPDRVIARDELRAEVWQGVAVSDSAIPTAVNALRKALGAGRDGAPIETLYGRGYRFTAPVAVRREIAEPKIAAGEGPFVGRAVVLERLHAVLAAARGGAGGLALLLGEPGIGKTRTAERIAHDARANGFTTLAGRCAEAEGAPHYWPWTRALRPLLARTDPPGEKLRGLDVPALARLLPELDGAPGVQTGVGAIHRFRVFDAVTEWLVRLSSDAPLLVSIEDLHWADEPSLELFPWLARELAERPVMLLATARSEEAHSSGAIARMLGELATHPRAERIDLTGLDEEEIAEYLSSEAEAAPLALARLLRERTEGNPFFLRETVRLLAAEGALASGASEAALRERLPPAVRDAVRRRLESLPPTCVETLRLAAALGRGLDVATLSSADGRPRESFLADVDRAVAAHILTEMPGRTGRLRFAHELVRETLLEDLAPGERAALYERVALAMLARHGDGPDAPAGEIALHLLRAAPRGHGDAALAWAERAARAAMARGAYEEAALHTARALEALALAPGATAERRLALLLLRGDALVRSGDVAPTREAFATAAALARELGRSADFVRAALGYGGSALWGNRPDASDRALLEDAERFAADGPAAERAMLAARLVATRAVWGPHEPERPASAEALGLARASGDSKAISEALHARHFVLQGPDHLEEREALALEILAIGAALRRLDRTFAIRETLAADRLIRGDRIGFAAMLDEANRAARASHHPAFAWLARSAEASAALLEGRFADAEQAMQEAGEHGRRARSPQALPLAIGQTLALRRAQGRLDEVLPLYARVAGDLAWLGTVPRVMLATIHAELGAPDRARAVLDEGLLDLAALPRRADWLLAMTELAFVCAATADAERGAAVHALLAPLEQLHAVYPGPMLYAGPVDHALGALAALLGRRDEAVARHEDALVSAEAVGAVPARARIACDLGALLLGSSRRGERDRGRTLVADALASAEALGMPPLAKRAAALLQAAPA